MATKVSLYHTYKVLEDNKHYKLIDIFIALCYLCIQVGTDNKKDTIFIIRSSCDSVYSLFKVVRSRFPYIKNRATFNMVVKRLIKMGILMYNSDEKAWQIVDMQFMYAKSEYDKDNSKKGFMPIYKQLLTEQFYNKSISEKKLIVLSLCLASSKSYRKKNLLCANILKGDSRWRKVLHSNNPYYIKKIFKDFLMKTKMFIDCSLNYRKHLFKKRQSREPNMGESSAGRIRKTLSFQFYFKAEPSSVTKHTDENSLEYYYNLTVSCRRYFDLMMDKIKKCPKAVQDKLNKPLQIALLSLTRNLSWRCKILLLDKIITKLFDDKVIVSPIRFVNTVIKTVI